MDDASETQALRDVQARLNARFPHLGDEVVEAAVRMAHSELTGPIRDFVPVLVEHAARERLASLTGLPPATAPRSDLAVGSYDPGAALGWGDGDDQAVPGHLRLRRS